MRPFSISSFLIILSTMMMMLNLAIAAPVGDNMKNDNDNDKRQVSQINHLSIKLCTVHTYNTHERKKQLLTWKKKTIQLGTLDYLAGVSAPNLHPSHPSHKNQPKPIPKRKKNTNRAKRQQTQGNPAVGALGNLAPQGNIMNSVHKIPVIETLGNFGTEGGKKSSASN